MIARTVCGLGVSARARLDDETDLGQALKLLYQQWLLGRLNRYYRLASLSCRTLSASLPSEPFPDRLDLLVRQEAAQLFVLATVGPYSRFTNRSVLWTVLPGSLGSVLFG